MPRARTTTKTVKTRERNALDDVLVASRPAESERIDHVLIGKVASVDGSTAVIDLPYPRFTQPVAARATIHVDGDAVGREVAVVFEGGRPEKPLVIGLI